MNRKFLLGALVGAAVVPGVAAATPKTGIVVDYRAASHSATIATKSGALIAIHSSKIRVGSRVRLTAVRTLANGTKAAKLVKIGKVKHAMIHGVVLSNVGSRGIVIGAKGTTFIVKKNASTTIKRSFSTGEIAPGTTVNVKVGFDGAELNAESVHEIKAPVEGQKVHIEGRVAVIDEATRTITVTTRDDGLVSVVTVQVPDVAVDLTKWVVGAEVEFRCTLNADGSYTLVASSRNEDENEADTPESEDDSTPDPGDGSASDSPIPA